MLLESSLPLLLLADMKTWLGEEGIESKADDLARNEGRRRGKRYSRKEGGGN